jgi:hypothetical protein
LDQNARLDGEAQSEASFHRSSTQNLNSFNAHGNRTLPVGSAQNLGEEKMVDAKAVFSGIMTGLHTEPPIQAMRKKLIINVAPTGSFTNREQNPLQPYTMAENVKAAIEAYKAGASVWHVHPRENNGLPSIDPKVAKETIDRVLDVCSDIITSVITYSDFNAQGAGLLRPMVEYLTTAGPRYVQTCPIVIRPSSISDAYTTVVTRNSITGVVEYLQDHGIRPEFQCDVNKRGRVTPPLPSGSTA